MFKCDMCGACCRHLDLSPLYQELNRGDGVCKYLNGNLCSIYEKRPDLCRIYEGYMLFFKDLMSLDEYYEKTQEACKILKNIN